MSLPYRISSNDANFVFPFSSNLVLSIVTTAVGLCPATSTGVVEISQENVIASGLSLIVAYDFSVGAAKQL